ncbi:hypothetical protein [Clostridium sp. E02]|nr:hypothetical protein [Clostridium sp. E02]
MEKETKKSEHSKKQPIWRDGNAPHPAGKCSSGMTFKSKKVKSG